MSFEDDDASIANKHATFSSSFSPVFYSSSSVSLMCVCVCECDFVIFVVVDCSCCDFFIQTSYVWFHTNIQVFITDFDAREIRRLLNCKVWSPDLNFGVTITSRYKTVRACDCATYVHVVLYIYVRWWFRNGQQQWQGYTHVIVFRCYFVLLACDRRQWVKHWYDIEAIVKLARFNRKSNGFKWSLGNNI